MPRGGARSGAGRPRKPLATHVLHGSYRRDRHGELPAGGRAAVLQMPPPTHDAPDVEALMTGLELEGRQLIIEMLAAYSGWTPTDLRCLRLSAELLDRRAQLRALIAALPSGETDQALRLLHSERRSGAEFLVAMKSISVAREVSS